MKTTRSKKSLDSVPLTWSCPAMYLLYILWTRVKRLWVFSNCLLFFIWYHSVDFMLIGKMICSEDPPPQLKVVNLQKEQIAIVCKLSCVHITWDTTPTYKPKVQVERLVRSRFIPARIKTTLHFHTYALYGGGEGVVSSLTKEHFLHF